jgi:hypothetical protein
MTKGPRCILTDVGSGSMPAARRKPHRRTRNDFPAIGGDLDGAPELIGKVQVDAAVMLTSADVNILSGCVELSAGLK